MKNFLERLNEIICETVGYKCLIVAILTVIAVVQTVAKLLEGIGLLINGEIMNASICSVRFAVWLLIAVILAALTKYFWERRPGNE